MKDFYSGAYTLRFVRSDRLTDIWRLCKNGGYVTDIVCAKGDTKTPADVLGIFTDLLRREGAA